MYIATPVRDGTLMAFCPCKLKLHASRKEPVIENHSSYVSTKIYVVGTQKNCLNEMVLLGTQNICFN